MKKVLLASIVLSCFSVSIVLFQISCKKSAQAQSTNSANGLQLNTIVYSIGLDSGVNVQNEYWLANLDGTNQRKVAITPPAGWYLTDDVRLTPDGKTLIFTLYDYSYPRTNALYSCTLDGQNLKKIVDNVNHKAIILGGAY
jgi:hypothetical protein